MPFPLNRRVGLFLILDAFILLGLAGVFAAVNRAVGPKNPAEANAKLAPTPIPFATPLVYAPPSESPQTTGHAWSVLNLWEKPKTDSAAQAGIPRTAATPMASLTRATIVPATIKTTAAVLDAQPGETVDLNRLRCTKIKVLTHKVEMKENYWQIAKNNNIDLLTLIGANPGLPYKAKINQSLYLLPQRGVLHTVGKEDSLATIAQAYGINEKDIKEANNIHWWNGIHPGDVLFLPGARPILMTKEWRDYYSRRGIFGDPLGRWGKINSAFSFRTDPLTGEVRHHNGVDLKAKYGDPVYAAGSGRVIFTGISGGYGNLIQIAHGNGYLTYYGHLSKIYVKAGQHVRKGLLIGRVGATGRVTGPHLHFEIRKKGKPLDPLLYI